MLSRRAHFAAVTFIGQLGGLVLATAAALLVAPVAWTGVVASGAAAATALLTLTLG
ncbi:hypothetical protein [Streptomyces cyaneus]|uniref:hypothetical protein n=1 Tax=Streptomyces cyaneus TaxID=1904 RepID=UPI001FE28FDF|nr:hypothetical protein [Streptomyces cyaneus]